jgi:hypothetical protein
MDLTKISVGVSIRCAKFEKSAAAAGERCRPENVDIIGAAERNMVKIATFDRGERLIWGVRVMDPC